MQHCCKGDQPFQWEMPNPADCVMVELEFCNGHRRRVKILFGGGVRGFGGQKSPSGLGDPSPSGIQGLSPGGGLGAEI